MNDAPCRDVTGGPVRPDDARADDDGTSPRPRRAPELSLQERVQELEQANRQLRLAQDHLESRALHDGLTGLPLRSVFLEKLTHALRRQARQHMPLAVLFCDLDRLKHVNDSYGHSAGDELIRCFVQRLRSCLRPADSIARIGGDEFVVLIEDLHDASEASVVAERVLEELRRPCEFNSARGRAAGMNVAPTASIGIAITRGDERAKGRESEDITADTLIAHADAAMYRAKRTGRGRYELFDPEAYQAERARNQLETELRGSLAGDQLELHYQPIVDLNTGSVYAVEALLRWQHPARGLLPAGDFIDLAEKSGLIVDLDAWVLKEACRQLATWDAALGDDAPGRLFINVSAAELSRPELEDRVTTAVAAAGIAPERVVLEVTETGVLDTAHAVGEALAALRGLGFDLAIDDFGTGYSSLARLVELPAGILKLDQSLVRNVHRNAEAAAVVSAVLLLGHNLHKLVIAEGVEDEETLQSLRELGCSYAQGYHLAQPTAP